MATILAISSQVASGHVGLSAIAPTLHAIGCDVIALPTVLLSNHPAHAAVAGTQTPPDVMIKMLDALSANGRLADVDCILTGYLPTAEHVTVANAAIAHVLRAQEQMVSSAPKASSPLSVVIDPVIGDWPKGRYIAEAAAVALRDELMRPALLNARLRVTTTPNVFELSWLTDHSIATPEDCVEAAMALAPARVLITSAPGPDTETIGVMAVETSNAAHPDATGETRQHAHVARREKVPHGTGDVFSAIVAGSTGYSGKRDLSRTVAALDALIAQSEGLPELNLIAALPNLSAALVGAKQADQARP